MKRRARSRRRRRCVSDQSSTPTVGTLSRGVHAVEVGGRRAERGDAVVLRLEARREGSCRVRGRGQHDVGDAGLRTRPIHWPAAPSRDGGDAEEQDGTSAGGWWSRRSARSARCSTTGFFSAGRARSRPRRHRPPVSRARLPRPARAAAIAGSASTTVAAGRASAAAPASPTRTSTQRRAQDERALRQQARDAREDQRAQQHAADEDRLVGACRTGAIAHSLTGVGVSVDDRVTRPRARARRRGWSGRRPGGRPPCRPGSPSPRARRTGVFSWCVVRSRRGKRIGPAATCVSRPARGCDGRSVRHRLVYINGDDNASRAQTGIRRVQRLACWRWCGGSRTPWTCIGAGIC